MGYSMLETRHYGHRAAKLALAVACAAVLGMGRAHAQACNDFQSSEFTKTAILTGLASPLKMKIASDNSIYFIQRTGVVSVVKAGTNAATKLLTLTVPGGSNNEDGLLGIALDPQFASNKYIYLFHTPTSPMGYRVSRYTLNGDALGEEKTILTIPHVFSAYGSLIIHGAGAMEFDPSGNLLISTGDLAITNGGFAVPVNENTNNFDAQKTSANSNNLLGKILRIKPKADGSGYTIPAGNLFPEGTANARPEVYAMGVRNPFTLTVDPKTGWAYSGEVGPDGAGAPIASQDEINQIKAAGNFGWPYLTGNNQAYSDMGGTKYNPTALVNNSKNNTGVKNLPNGVSALFYMANGSSWPITGITPKQGNRCIKVGGFYRFNAQGTNAKRLPPYFENSFFMANHNDGETMRVVKLNEDGTIKEIRSFLTGMARPISFEIGPDGALYTMEWGGDNGHWFNANNGVLSRVSYNGACSVTNLRHDFANEALAMQGRKTILPGTHIAFPKGAAKVELFDMKGAKRFSANASGAIGGAAVIPASFEAGLMMVKFSAK